MADIPSPEQFMAQQSTSEEPKAETSGTTPSPEQFMKQEKPMAERIFGPGVGKEATAGERALATGEQAAGAAVTSVALQRVMQKMALRHTAAAMTGVGASPFVQGSLMAMDAYELAKMTAAGGAVASLVEQSAEKMGAGRGTQVAMGSILPGVGPTLARGAMGAVEAAGPTLGKMAKAGSYMLDTVAPGVGYKARMIGAGLKGVGEEKLRQEAVDAARTQALAGTSPEAAGKVAGAVEQGVNQEVGKFRTKLELDKARAAAAVKTAESEQALAAEQAKSGLVGPKPHELGGEIQQAVSKEQEKLLKERATGYRERFNAALDSARTKERAGEPFAKSEEGVKLRGKLDSFIKGTGSPVSDYTPDQKLQFSKLKDQIFGKPPVLNENGEVVTPGIKPASAKQLDTLVRRLGDAAFGKEAEGAKAIDSQVAKDTRELILKGADGKGGIYAWEPKFAEAKQFYKAKSDELGPWSTKRGQAVTSKEDFQGVLAQRPAMEAEKVAGQYFKTARGFDDLTQQLGGNTQKAIQFGEQHAMRELEGTTASKAQSWLDNQSWLNNPKAKPVRDKVETYILEQQQKEARLGATGEKVAEAKSIPFIKDIDEKVAAHRNALENRFGVGSTVDGQIESAIGKPLRTKDVQALKSILTSSPEAMKALPDAALQYVVKGSTKETINQRAEQVIKNLSKNGLLSEAEGAKILSEANRVSGAMEGPIKSRKQLDTWAEHFKKRLVGAVSRTVSSAGAGQTREE